MDDMHVNRNLIKNALLFPKQFVALINPILSNICEVFLDKDFYSVLMTKQDTGLAQYQF